MRIRYRPAAKKSAPKAAATRQPAQPFIKQQGSTIANENFFHSLSSSQVPQLHTDEQAAQLAGHFQANAFAYNNHIFFNKNQYQPHTTAGKKLLAHELVHVKQNRPVIARDPTEEDPVKIAAAKAAEEKSKAAEIVTIKALGILEVEDGSTAFTSAELKLVTQALTNIPKEDKDAFKGAKLKRVTSLGGTTAGQYTSRQAYDETTVTDEQMIELSNLCFEANMPPAESVRVIIHEVGHAVASKPFVKTNRDTIKQGLKTNQAIVASNAAGDELTVANDANTVAVEANNAALDVYDAAVKSKDAAAIAAAKADYLIKKKEWDKALAERTAKETVNTAKTKIKDDEKAVLVTKETAAKAKEADVTSFSTNAATVYASMGTAYTAAKPAIDKPDAENSAYAASLTAAQDGIKKFYDENVTVTTELSTAEAAKASTDALLQDRNDKRAALTSANKDNPMLAVASGLQAAQDACLKAAALVAFNRTMNLSVKKFYDLVIANNISPSLTPYAAENWPQKPEEFYADAYSFFITKPTGLEAHSKVLYDWFKAGKYR